MNIVTTETQSASGNCIAREVPSPSEGWRSSMKAAFRSLDALCRYLELPVEAVASGLPATKDFPLFVPREFAAKMQPGDASDPLLRQVLPSEQETIATEGFTTNPVGDHEATLTPGLLQKYHGRALMITTGACAVHCRYCFRRHFPYGESPKGLEAWEPALAAIAEDASIQEILLSGGDPLTLSDPILRQLSHKIAQASHVQRLRIHTRLPIMIPSRVNDDLLAWLTETRLRPIMVVHANHPHELGDDVAAALGRLAEAGVPLMNQTVLLRGVNDDAATLIELSERLFACRVMPYYLHQLDRVAGAAHFQVERAQGLQIVATMRSSLPGYLVPRYVEEIAGDTSKRIIA
ncbi:EF-P beta-lysylation protein EpmB [Bremerella cremea]|uniref:L-lysine 2,3-aminomutase n=1 Tax=Bremerella cremea TaxID=1031537 RepID=A0A368KVB0_9BACT|nr:EF-P beta-lysylation protein EpmB [Bremerella cremea]RCS52822.1 EF-P beta-lysylation protein EpmB [Bremerella cremea]